MSKIVPRCKKAYGQWSPPKKTFFCKWKNGVCLAMYVSMLLIAEMFLAVLPLSASDTLLMFVGQDLEIVSLASRREEAAWNAPAIADVITKKQIENSKNTTLAGLLGKSAGFFINDRESGSIPYLRGIPDSALFLYDTVPMGSGAGKSNHGIDDETSLAAIKRVEIVRGAGSVLWGPDAFAGVVNIVPLTGKDFQGIETGAGFSSEKDTRWTYLNAGKDQGNWNAFMSMSAKKMQDEKDGFNVIRFWNDDITPTPPDDRFGDKTSDDSHFYELYSSVTFNDWITLSTRFSDSKKTYIVVNSTGDYIWEETQSTPARTIKLEASKETGLNSGIRFTGYYSDNHSQLDIIDKNFDSSERSLYGELIYDQALFVGNGLLTTGMSRRKTTFRDILVWKSFFPDYLDAENRYLLPLFETTNYENDLTSFFGQYRHKFSGLELWAGLRNDSHHYLEDKISYSAGLAWDFFPDFMFKAIYGTAYRIPSAEQIMEGGNARLEEIKSLNAQIAWKSGTRKEASLTLFRNAVADHTIEDRYSGAGLSTPNEQTIYGLELEWEVPLAPAISFSGNLTLLDNRGPDETYNYGRYFYEDTTGSIQEGFFQTLEYPYDTGADILANLAVNWQITKNFTLISELHYVSKTDIHYLQETNPGTPAQEITVTSPDVWLMDLHLKAKNIFPFSVDLFIENLWDRDYVKPGQYIMEPGASFNAGIMIKKKW